MSFAAGSPRGSSAGADARRARRRAPPRGRRRAAGRRRTGRTGRRRATAGRRPRRGRCGTAVAANALAPGGAGGDPEAPPVGVDDLVTAREQPEADLAARRVQRLSQRRSAPVAHADDPRGASPAGRVEHVAPVDPGMPGRPPGRTFRADGRDSFVGVHAPRRSAPIDGDHRPPVAARPRSGRRVPCGRPGRHHDGTGAREGRGRRAT